MRSRPALLVFSLTWLSSACESTSEGDRPDSTIALDAAADAGADGSRVDDSSALRDGDATADLDAARDGQAMPEAGNDSEASISSPESGAPNDASHEGGALHDGAPNDAGGDGGSPAVGACATVNASGSTLLDIGHGTYVHELWTTASRIVSADHFGRWVLHDSVTGAVVGASQGASTCRSGGLKCSELKGNLLVTLRAEQGTLELRSATDGSLLGTVQHGGSEPSRFGVAADGSYSWTATESELHAWSPTGASLFSRAGNYLSSSPVASASLLQVANGPAGSNVLETFDVAAAGARTTATYLGVFSRWFGDGTKFLTSESGTYRIYSSGAVQQQIVSLPGVSSVDGYGQYFWTSAGQVYAIGGGSQPVLSISLGLQSVLYGRGRFLVVQNDAERTVRTVDLAASNLTLRSVTPRLAAGAWLSRFHPVSDDSWIALGQEGAVLQQVAGVAEARALSCGRVASVSLSDEGSWAIATDAQILAGEVAQRRVSRVIPIRASKVQFSDDGRLLAARWVEPNQVVVRLFDGATGEATREFASPTTAGGPYVADFALSPDGSRLALRRCTGAGGGSTSCQENVVLIANAGTPELTTPATTAPAYVALSRQGETAASVPDGYGTNIYNGAALVGAAAGVPLVWLDDHKLVLARTLARDRTIVGPYRAVVTAVVATDGSDAPGFAEVDLIVYPPCRFPRCLPSTMPAPLASTLWARSTIS